jgi:hypothetical protein
VWDEAETITTANRENRSAEACESTPPPQAEASVEPGLEEATLEEGTHLVAVSTCPVE